MQSIFTSIMSFDLQIILTCFIFLRTLCFFLYHFTKVYISQIRKQRQQELLRCQPRSHTWLAAEPGLVPHFPMTALPCLHLYTTLSFHSLPSQKAELLVSTTLPGWLNIGEIPQLQITPLTFSITSHPNNGLPPTIFDNIIPYPCLGELGQQWPSGSS